MALLSLVCLYCYLEKMYLLLSARAHIEKVIHFLSISTQSLSGDIENVSISYLKRLCWLAL
jgi:hypothetical protein